MSPKKSDFQDSRLARAMARTKASHDEATRRLARAMKRAKTSRREAIRRLESLAVSRAGQSTLPDVGSVEADIRRVFDALDTNFAGGFDAMKKVERAREDRLAWKIARAVKAEAAPRPTAPQAPAEAAPPAPVEAIHTPTTAPRQRARGEPKAETLKCWKADYDEVKRFFDGRHGRSVLKAAEIAATTTGRSAEALRRGYYHYKKYKNDKKRLGKLGKK